MIIYFRLKYLCFSNFTPIKTNHRIFLVEDDIDDQDLFRDSLYAIDPHITLTCFIYGKDFIEELEKIPADALPGLVILDYNIPGINGAGILQYLKDNGRYDGVISVVWSTSNSDKYRKDCFALGAQDYLVKPLDMAGMEALAKTVLRFIR